MIQVVVLEDQKIFRQGLAALLGERADMVVVGDAADIASAHEVVIQCRPDVIVIDIDSPGIIGFQLIRELRRTAPELRAIILGGHCRDEFIEEAVVSGAWGYLLKHQGIEDLCEAIINVAAGKLQYAPEIMERLEAMEGGIRLGSRPKSRLASLTLREREVLTLLAEGRSLKELAAELHISSKTADKHKVNLMRKLNIHDRVELARYAIRENIIQA